ncbi:MAG: NTP transferase domain-containing protein, partial [Planctomycetales bacterium]|nr:NTP transferase domain-containing protein [Planctomycetales bacterium]
MRSFAVVPAAGESRRMGRPKLLLPWGDSTVIQTVLAAWQASRVDRVLVVVRPDDAELAEVCGRAGATVVVPGESPPEMKRSIQLALHEIHDRHAPTDADAWLLAPADMPRLSTTIINRLIAEHADALRDDRAEPAILLPIVGQ